MGWKILLALCIIIAVAGLLIFSPQGRELREKYLDKYIKTVGSYLTSIKSRFIKPKPINRTLDITVTIDSSNIRGQEFEADGNSFDAKLSYDSIFLGEQKINVEDGEVEFKTDSMTGSISIDTNGKFRVSGQAKSVKLNDITFTPKSEKEEIEFSFIGTPISFSLSNLAKDRMILSGVSGTLSLQKWSPLALENDDLDILNFLGSIEQDDETVIITGKAEKVTLNGVDLSLKI